MQAMEDTNTKETETDKEEENPSKERNGTTDDFTHTMGHRLFLFNFLSYI